MPDDATRLPLTGADHARLASVLPTLDVARGMTGFSVTPLAQHASSRSYHRVRLTLPPGTAPSHETLVVMKLGEEPLRPDERTGGPAPSRLPFIDVGEALQAADVAVPAIHYYSEQGERGGEAGGLLVLDDLGDETFEDRLRAVPRAEWGAWYRRAVALLVRIHASEPTLRARGSIAVQRAFGADLLRWELEHFREWGLEARGVSLTRAEAAVLDVAFVRIVDELQRVPYGLSHRDYQSRNLMVTPAGLVVIDFQDALRAPVVYDLVALLRDSYVVLTPDEVDGALADYVSLRGADALPLSPDALREAFWWMTAQRKLKDAGRFVFIERVKGDPSFLRHIPDSLGYVREALQRLPALAALSDVLHERLPEWRESAT